MGWTSPVAKFKPMNTQIQLILLHQQSKGRKTIACMLAIAKIESRNTQRSSIAQLLSNTPSPYESYLPF